MKHNKAIPIAFNMSFGLLPLIISIILIEFFGARYSLLIGLTIGFAYSILSFYLSGKRIYNFVAYKVTAVLFIFTIGELLFPNVMADHFLPFALSTFVLILTGFFFYGQRVIKRFCKNIKDHNRLDLIAKSLDSSIVSARLIFITGILNFAIIILALLFMYPLSTTATTFLFTILPLVFLCLVIGVNQIAIYFANRITTNEIEIPLVNEHGDVIGKRYKMEIPCYKNQYINPVIRIAFIFNGMLFLCNRQPENIIDVNKTDVPVETFLEFGESLAQGVHRIIQRIYGNKDAIKPRFTLKYSFKNDETNRLIYLYINYMDNEELLRNKYFVNGKLWTFQQIEQNLGMNYFGQEFENEYEYLKETVKIWEEFR